MRAIGSKKRDSIVLMKKEGTSITWRLMARLLKNAASASAVESKPISGRDSEGGLGWNGKETPGEGEKEEGEGTEFKAGGATSRTWIGP